MESDASPAELASQAAAAAQAASKNAVAGVSEAPGSIAVAGVFETEEEAQSVVALLGRHEIPSSAMHAPNLGHVEVNDVNGPRTTVVTPARFVDSARKVIKSEH